MKRLLGVVLALLVIGLIAWLASHLERVKESTDSGPTDVARRNPFLACERLFAEFGLSTSRQATLAEPPPVDVCTFVWACGGRESERTSTMLLEWVAAGGQLVVLLPSRSERRLLLKHALAKARYEFPLARELGIELHTDYVVPDGDGEEQSDAEPETTSSSADTTSTLDLGAEPFRVALERDIWIGATDAGDSGDIEFVSRRTHGAGRVTFVTSDAWMTNEHIGEHDHARFAWQLANLGGRPRGVWFISSERQPGLFAWIAREGWMVLASGLVLVALWLWKSAARFGPTIADPPRDRRDFSEHIEATADFLWRRGETAVLLAAPRAELAQRLALMRPDLAGSKDGALALELARVGEMDAAVVREALESKRVAEPAAFQRIVRNLARLRSSL